MEFSDYSGHTLDKLIVNIIGDFKLSPNNVILGMKVKDIHNFSMYTHFYTVFLHRNLINIVKLVICTSLLIIKNLIKLLFN